MSDKQGFWAGLREGWRTARVPEQTILMICYATSVTAALALILHSRIN